MKTAIAVSVLAVAGCLCALLLTIRATVAAVPGEIQATREALSKQVQALTIAALGEIDSQASGIRQDARIMILRATKDANSQISIMTDDANRQLTGLTLKLEDAVNKADGQITGIRAEISPVLANIAVLTVNAASLTKDAQDSLDDLYPDMRGLVESATVATTQAAQTAEVVRAAAPQFLATAQESNKQFAGIATDVHTFTTKFTAPVSLKTKIWDGFKSMALIASHF